MNQEDHMYILVFGSFIEKKENTQHHKHIVYLV